MHRTVAAGIGLVLLWAPQAAVARRHQAKPAASRWAIKTSVPPGADLYTLREVPLAELTSLPDPPGIGKDDRRYARQRIPPFENGLGLKEGDIVSATGWLARVTLEADGDYRLLVSARPEREGAHLTARIPDPSPENMTDPILRARADAARAAVRAVLRGQGEPSRKGALVGRRVRVRVTGQLFYDVATRWELHPVTSVEYLSE